MTKIHDFRIFNNICVKNLYYVYNYSQDSKDLSKYSLLKYINCKNMNKDINNVTEAILEYNKISTASPNSLLFIYLNPDYNEIDFFKIFSILQYENRTDLVLITKKSIIAKLSIGINKIFVSEYFTGKGIGIIPLVESKISTSGLIWDIKDKITKIGGDIISTSNSSINNKTYIDVELQYGCAFISFELKSNI